MVLSFCQKTSLKFFMAASLLIWMNVHTTTTNPSWRAQLAEHFTRLRPPQEFSTANVYSYMTASYNVLTTWCSCAYCWITASRKETHDNNLVTRYIKFSFKGRWKPDAGTAHNATHKHREQQQIRLMITRSLCSVRVCFQCFTFLVQDTQLANTRQPHCRIIHYYYSRYC